MKTTYTKTISATVDYDRIIDFVFPESMREECETDVFTFDTDSEYYYVNSIKWAVREMIDNLYSSYNVKDIINATIFKEHVEEITENAEKYFKENYPEEYEKYYLPFVYKKGVII